MVPKIEVFLLYASKEEAFLDELETHLASLKHLISLWHAGELLPGAEQKQEIKKHLEQAQIILLLISPHFISSINGDSTEIKRAMEKHERGEAIVIPVILKPVFGWENISAGGNTKLGSLQPLPKGPNPITKWEDQDEAWRDVAEGINSIVDDLKKYLSDAVVDYRRRMDEAVSKQAVASSPYKFLDSFKIEDAPIFFGRDTAINALFDKVVGQKLTVLHAKSGAGKTSLLNAGLSSRLLKLQPHWFPLYVRVSESEDKDPIQAIKRAVAPLYLPASRPTLLMSLSLHDFLCRVCDLLDLRTNKLVIILDQFEEFFRFLPDEKDRSVFIKELAICYNDEALSVYVHWLISLRKEYFSDLAEFEPSLPTIFDSRYRLNPLTREEAKAAITGPIAKLDPSVKYNEDLLAMLLNDLAANNMELPLLQMLCTQLYKQRTSNQLTVEMYNVLGRAEGVLGCYLNEFLAELAELAEQKRTLAKAVLKALVRSDGLKQYVSDQMLKAQVLTVYAEAQPEDLENVLERLVNARLLHKDKLEDKEVEGKYRYELAHEYLITEIRNWIDPADLEFKQVEELLQREMINWRAHHVPIPKERLEILFRHKDQFTSLDSETWACLVHSSLVVDFAITDWVKTVSEGNDPVLFKAIVQQLIITLRDKNEHVRRNAASTLGKLKDERAVEPLIAALLNKDQYVRMGAASALGEMEDERAIEPLIAVLRDENEDVRRNAVSALGKLEDERAIEPLIAALRDKDRYVRRNAVSALGEIKDERAVEPLIAALRDENEEVRGNAASALGEIKDERAVEPLIAVLRDENEEVRGNAASALGEIKDERAVEPLIAALRDENEDVRRNAASALGKLKDERVVEPLIAALLDKDQYVRGSAVYALGKLKDERAVEPLIAALLEDQYVRRSAASALGEIKDERAVEPLIAALLDKDQYVRRSAVYALGEIKDERAVEPLIAALRDEDEDVRSRAVSALGEMEDERAVEPLIAALLDKDQYVRWLAVNALGELKDERAVEPLIAVLRDEDEYVRWLAVNALGEIKDEQAIDPLMAALIAVLRAEDEHGRWFAEEVLRELKGERAVGPLIAALRDEGKGVRWLAEEALKKIQNA